MDNTEVYYDRELVTEVIIYLDECMKAIEEYEATFDEKIKPFKTENCLKNAYYPVYKDESKGETYIKTEKPEMIREETLEFRTLLKDRAGIIEDYIIETAQKRLNGKLGKNIGNYSYVSSSNPSVMTSDDGYVPDTTPDKPQSTDPKPETPIKKEDKEETKKEEEKTVVEETKKDDTKKDDPIKPSSSSGVEHNTPTTTTETTKKPTSTLANTLSSTGASVKNAVTGKVTEEKKATIAAAGGKLVSSVTAIAAGKESVQPTKINIVDDKDNSKDKKENKAKKFVPPIAGLSAAGVAGVGTNMYMTKDKDDEDDDKKKKDKDKKETLIEQVIKNKDKPEKNEENDNKTYTDKLLDEIEKKY